MHRLATAAALVAFALGVLTPASGEAARLGGTYFLVRPDPRLCPSPYCGGWWASVVNERVTRCADGTRQPACYVARIDGARVAPTDRRPAASFGESALVHGKLVLGGVEGFPQLARLVADGSWRPASTQSALGTFVLLADSGVRCVTQPCFSIRRTTLNVGGRRDLSGVSFAGTGASADLVRRAREELGAGSLLAAGAESTVKKAGPAGAGRVFRVVQFYLPA